MEGCITLLLTYIAYAALVTAGFALAPVTVTFALIFFTYAILWRRKR